MCNLVHNSEFGSNDVSEQDGLLDLESSKKVLQRNPVESTKWKVNFGYQRILRDEFLTCVEIRNARACSYSGTFLGPIKTRM